MEIHGYPKNCKAPLIAELPNVQNLDYFILKGKSGIEVEIHGKNESASLTVGEKSYDLESRDGELFVDGFCISSLIDKEINQEWAMAKEKHSDNQKKVMEYISKVAGEIELKIQITNKKENICQKRTP